MAKDRKRFKAEIDGFKLFYSGYLRSTGIHQSRQNARLHCSTSCIRAVVRVFVVNFLLLF